MSYHRIKSSYVDASFQDYARPQFNNYKPSYVPMKLSHGPGMHQSFSRIQGDVVIINEPPQKYVLKRQAFDWYKNFSIYF